MVAEFVGYVEENAGCHTCYKIASNPIDGRWLQRSKQYDIWSLDDKERAGPHLMPEEIFSKRNRMADDGTLGKTLFYDISRQAQVPAAIASVDALNC